MWTESSVKKNKKDFHTYYFNSGSNIMEMSKERHFFLLYAKDKPLSVLRRKTSLEMTNLFWQNK